jgi:hypothetical protein
MRNVQLMKKNIYIFRVNHIRIIAKKNWFARHETDRFLNNHCQECVCAYEASMIVYIFSSRGHKAIKKYVCLCQKNLGLVGWH